MFKTEKKKKYFEYVSNKCLHGDNDEYNEYSFLFDLKFFYFEVLEDSNNKLSINASLHNSRWYVQYEISFDRDDILKMNISIHKAINLKSLEDDVRLLFL